MIPEREVAVEELEIAGRMNPGPWINHSLNVALAAENIAKECNNLDSEKAYVLGLLHDIGRRTGIAATRHIIDGYDYVISKGWDEVGRICLTHSFPIKNIEIDMGKKDITPEQYCFIEQYLNELEYNEYDKLIILCDSLADANGLCILEKRFVDTTRRYGIFPFTIDRWNKTIEYREYFEDLMGKSVYSVLPNIENCIYH
ncbi:MAG: HD domain-containing protein [Lachnospira sp.]|nr:HD domain-containing protein [Lachnospira sp.]